jgi:hypothetical protein
MRPASRRDIWAALDRLTDELAAPEGGHSHFWASERAGEDHGEPPVWTPLDTSTHEVSNPEALSLCGIGHSGHLGHLDTGHTREGTSSNGEKIAEFFAPEGASFARRISFSGVQDVQGVQSQAVRGFPVGHLNSAGVQSVQSRGLSRVRDGEGASSAGGLDTLDTTPSPDRLADARDQFHERAAIAEFDGGMSRADAERAAYDEIAARYGRAVADEMMDR